MTVPASHYYIEYKEFEKSSIENEVLRRGINRSFLSDESIEYQRSYSVSNDRTILVNGLKPGITYTTSLVASDGISAETKSDPQIVTTLSKGMFSLSFYILLH